MSTFNATTAGQPIVDNDRLTALVKTLGQHRLGLRDVQPDLLGNAYEYLIRKFAEGQGQSAGEFYTPAEVGRIMARISIPNLGCPYTTRAVDHPVCSSNATSAFWRLTASGERAPCTSTESCTTEALRTGDQSIDFAMSRMNAFLHDMDAEIALGDTMRQSSLHGPCRSSSSIRPRHGEPDVESGLS